MKRMFDGDFAGVFDPSRSRPEPGRLRVVLTHAGIEGTVVEDGPFTIAGAEILRSDHGPIVVAGPMRDPDGRPADVRSVRASWARCGERALHAYEGSFALACWDRGLGCGLLAQDQLGGRSLYVAGVGRGVAFASEIALLLDLLVQSRAPDETALAHWLADRGVYGGQTLYEGITRLQGGHCLRLGPEGQLGWRRWWAPAPEPLLTGSCAELGAALIAAVDRAVGAELEGKSAHGVLLSGGLDSSLVAAVGARAARRHGAQLRAFSAVFPAEPELDESSWAAQVTEHAGLEFERVEISPREPLRLLAQWIEVWRVPLLSPGLMIERPLLAAARAAGIGHVIDGQGGDELFAAPGFVLSDLLRDGRLPSLVRLTRRYPGLVDPRDLRRLAQVWRQVVVPGAIPYAWRRPATRRFDSDPTWLSDRLARLRVQAIDPWKWKRRDGPLWWRALSDTLTEQRERADISDYVRRRGILCGVRCASPLLSLPLVETTLRLPPQLGFDPSWTRAVVRHSAGLLPDAVRYRRGKTDFSELYLRALTTAQSMAAIADLLGTRSELSAFLDMRPVREALLDRGIPASGPARHEWLVQVWNLISAEQWLRSLTS